MSPTSFGAARAVITSRDLGESFAEASFATGYFQLPDGTGNLAVTGLGFQPDAVIFFMTGGTLTEGGSHTYLINLRGFMTATEASSVCGSDTQSTSSMHHDHSTTSCRVISVGGATLWEWTPASMDAGGFTMNFSTSYGSVDYNMGFLAIGNVSANVLQWSVPTSAGDHSVTGAGFQPTFAMHVQGSDATVGASPDSYIGMGFAGRVGNHCNMHGIQTNNRAGTGIREVMTLKHTLKSVEAGTVVHETRHKSFDSDGFTVDVETPFGSTRPVSTLVLDTVDVVIRPFTSNASTGNVTTDYVGHTPSAFLFTFTREANPMELLRQGSMYPSIGAWAGTGGNVGYAAMQSDGSLSYARSKWRTDALYSCFLTDETRGDVTGTGTDSFTINYAMHALAGVIGFTAISFAKNSTYAEDYTAEVMGDSPVGYWPLDQAYGSSSLDRGYYGEHASVAGSPTFVTSGPWTGKGAADFPGNAADRLTVDPSTRIWTPSVGGDMSFECWLRWDTTTGFKTAISTQSTDTTEAWVGIQVDGDDILGFGRTTSHTWVNTPVYTGTVNTWYHVVITTNNTTAKNTLYVNGALVGDSGTATIRTTRPALIAIGANNDASSGWNLPWRGQLAGVAAYDRILSDAEILSHYNTGNGMP